MPTTTSNLSPAQPISISPDWKVQLSQAVTSIDQLLSCLDLAPEQLSTQPAGSFGIFPQGAATLYRSHATWEPQRPAATSGTAASPTKCAESRLQQGPTAKRASTTLLRALYINTPIDCCWLLAQPVRLTVATVFAATFPTMKIVRVKQQWQTRTGLYSPGHNSINEVIYSGGDPLAANDQLSRWLTDRNCRDSPYQTAAHSHQIYQW